MPTEAPSPAARAARHPHGARPELRRDLTAIGATRVGWVLERVEAGTSPVGCACLSALEGSYRWSGVVPCAQRCRCWHSRRPRARARWWPRTSPSRSSARTPPRSRSPGTGSSTRRCRPRLTPAASSTRFADDLGYSGDMERTLREVAEIDAAGHHLRRRLRQRGGRAQASPRTTRTSPSSSARAAAPPNPNFSVFDNWIHEPAYLAGMLAGGLTKSGVIGVVGGAARARGQPHHQRLHRRRPRGQPGGRGQGQLHQQLVRPGDRQGGRAGPDRRRRGRALRGALRRHRGGRREGPPRRRQHERPAVAGPGQRHHQRHLEHDAHGRVRHRPGRRRHLHGPGPQGLQHGGQGRRRAGAHQHGARQAGPERAGRTRSWPRRRTSCRASSGSTSTKAPPPGSVIPETE